MHENYAKHIVGQQKRLDLRLLSPVFRNLRLIITNSFSLPASLMVLFCLGSPHASRIGQVFEAIEGAVPQSPEATGSNFKQEMVIIFVGAQKRVAPTLTNLKKIAICVQAKECLRCHLSDASKQKKEVTRNL